MKKLFRYALLACLLGAAYPVSAAAGDLKLSIAGGRVTLIAQDVPLSQILTEWARIGQTSFVNAEKLTGASVTLQLVDVPEKQALDLLLHSASGYMAAQRPVGAVGASLYDRVMIMPTSRPPAVSASAAPPAFTRPPVVQPQPVPVDDDEGEPGDQGAPQPGAAPPATMPQPGMMPQPQPGANQPPYPGVPQQPGQQVPTTAPRPGMLPVPTPATPGNPYQTYPPPNVVRRPGGDL